VRGVRPAFACNAPTRARTVKNLLDHTLQTDTGQPGSTSPAGAEQTCDARRSEQCQRKRECQAARAEDGAERRQAPIQLGPGAACRPIRTACVPRTHAAPPQRHGRRHMAAARPGTAAQERWRAPDAGSAWLRPRSALVPAAPGACGSASGLSPAWTTPTPAAPPAASPPARKAAPRAARPTPPPFLRIYLIIYTPCMAARGSATHTILYSDGKVSRSAFHQCMARNFLTKFS